MLQNKKIFKAMLLLTILSQIPLVSALRGQALETGSGAVGKIVVKKVNQDGSQALAGALFTLTSQDGQVIDSAATAENSGETLFDNLAPGTYSLTEKTAPAGYKKSEKTWTVKVASNGATTVEDAQGETLEQRKEELNATYPTTSTYTDTQQAYNLVTITDSQDGTQFKAVNPETPEREIEEGKLSKRISQVDDLSQNKYNIELTVEGKTTVESKITGQPLDVVILLDNSNSMANERNNGANRAKQAGEAVQRLIDKVTSNSENRVALVTYGSTIFDGTQATVQKGQQDSKGKAYNPSSNWSYDQTSFTTNVIDASYLTLTNDKAEIEKMKAKVPMDAAHLNESEKLQYQFGATFTQKALMKADDILSTQSDSSRQKIVLHVTDGVPTMSYPIDLYAGSSGYSYQAKLDSLKKIGGGDGILKSSYIIDDAQVKGDGETYNLFNDKRVLLAQPSNRVILDNNTTGGVQALDQISGYGYDELKALGYDVIAYGQYKGMIESYWRDYQWAYPTDSKGFKFTDHGEPTRLYFNANIKPKGYDIFTVGIGVNGDPGTNQQTATSLMQSLSSKPENYVNVEDASKVFDELNKFFSTVTVEKHSIVDGTVEDPMGEMIDFQLGDDGVFDPSDYTLVGSDGSELVNNQATGGDDQQGGLLKGVSVTFDKATQRIKILGLNLGEGQKVTLNYKVRLKDDYISNTFYETNGRTTLNPKSETPTVLRDFPIPQIRAIREYPVLSIKNEKQLGEIDFIKVNKENLSETLAGAQFQLQIEKDYYGTKLYVPEGSSITTQADGKIHLANLEDGNYKLYEQAAPSNYFEVKTKPVLSFRVSQGAVVDIVQDPTAEANHIGYLNQDGQHLITNTPKIPPGVFPKTGGIGSLPFILFGCCVMVFAVSYKRKSS